MTVREKPILFSGPMVCAILDGRKTQTRRVVPSELTGEMKDLHTPVCFMDFCLRHCKYGVPKEHLWVRETWKPHCEGPISEEFPLGTCVKYKADGALLKPERWTAEQGFWCESREETKRWYPAIHMPRWASRLTLEVVSVRVERLQQISDHDVEAEGWHCSDPGHGNGGCLWSYPGRTDKTFTDAQEAFAFGWDSINAKRGHGWNTNPWVWAITFKNL